MNAETKDFVESAHARWLAESDDGVQGKQTKPIPDPSSDINKLLNSVHVA